jgi:hypothetical protein
MLGLALLSLLFFDSKHQGRMCVGAAGSHLSCNPGRFAENVPIDSNDRARLVVAIIAFDQGQEEMPFVMELRQEG